MVMGLIILFVGFHFLKFILKLKFLAQLSFCSNLLIILPFRDETLVSRSKAFLQLLSFHKSYQSIYSHTFRSVLPFGVSTFQLNFQVSSPHFQHLKRLKHLKHQRLIHWNLKFHYHYLRLKSKLVSSFLALEVHSASWP